MVEAMEDNQVVVLIEAIRDYPQLWDPLHADHGRKDICTANWNAICNRAATYGVIVNVEEVKRIWRSLRDTYKRIRSKEGPGTKIRWRFFNDMSFLPANLMDALNGTTNPAPKRPAPPMELLEPFRNQSIEIPSTSMLSQEVPLKRRLLQKRHEMEEMQIRKELLAIEKAQSELEMRKKSLQLQLEELQLKHETEILKEELDSATKNQSEMRNIFMDAPIKAEDLLGDDEL